MIFKRTQFILAIICLIAASVGSAVFLYFFNFKQQLEINFLDVSQGDSIFIKTPDGQNIIIDGGDSSAPITQRLAKVLPFYDRTIDLMVLSHPHDDHAGGLVKVLKRYPVEKILYTGVVQSSPAYLAWLAEIKNRNIPLTIIDRPQEINLGQDLKIKILWPRESFLNKEAENLNNSSIVMKLIYKNNSFLLVGDAEQEVEQALLDSGVDVKADVLKTGHHGSDTSSTEEFLAAVKPQYAIISVGKNNDFGHPSLRVIKRLERLGINIYRTDEQGWIKIKSDGKMVDIKTEK